MAPNLYFASEILSPTVLVLLQRRLPWTLLSAVAAALAAISSSAYAQKPVFFDYPQTTAAQQSLQWTALPRWMAIDWELRSRTEGQTSLNEVSEDGRIYDLTRIRGGFEVRPTSFITGYMQFEDNHALGLPLDQVASNMRNSFDLFQGYADIHYQTVNLVAGRQLLRYGSERVVGISDLANNSRSWDGFRGRWGNKNFIDLFSTSVVAVHPTSLDKHGAGLTFHGAVGTLTTLLPEDSG
jgi:Alginate export